MSGRTSTWRRPATRVYDYNYKYGEHYYNPQLSHIDKKEKGVAVEPPAAKTFAERYAERPFYGQARDFDRSNTDAPSRSYSVPPPTDSYKPRQPAGDEDSAPRRRPKFNFDDEPVRANGKPSQPARTKLDDEIDDLLKDLDNIPRRRRVITTPDSEDLNTDSFLKDLNNKYDSKLKKAGITSPTDDVTKKIVDYHIPSLDDEKRRLRLKALEEELAQLAASTEIVKPARRQTNQDRLAAAELAESFESSMKIRKRNVKTTVTTETVKY